MNQTKRPDTKSNPSSPSIEIREDERESRFLFTGAFTLQSQPPALPDSPKTSANRSFVADGSGLASWDSALLIRIQQLRERFSGSGQTLRLENFPDQVMHLIESLPETGAESSGPDAAETENPIERIGGSTLELVSSLRNFPIFIGETCQSVGRLFRGRAVFQRGDLLNLFWENSGRSLGIVLLITVLTGLIMAFVGAIQLSQFGADIFVANLVTIAMFREMGAMMAAIILAGRTGSAFAAQIGSMKANDELNALRTMGVSPFDFIVLPRLVTLILMMPVLAFLGSIAGVLGGMIVTVGFMDITATAYLNQASSSIGGATLFGGIVKSFFFGAIIALTGCYKGLAAGSSAESVGRAATSAVVTSIVWIIVADAIFAILFFLYGI